MYKIKLKKLTKNEIFLFIAMNFMAIVMIGICYNFTAVANNGGKMPVKADFNYEDNTHFTYQNNSEIKNGILSDYIYFADNIISIGDILIIFGALFYIFSN
jgi:hypothetical protein